VILSGENDDIAYAVNAGINIRKQSTGPDLTTTLAEAFRVLRPGGRLVAVHAVPELSDDDLAQATQPLRAFRSERPDSPAALRTAADGAGFRCLAQHPARPRITQHSPLDVAELIRRRVWSFLWHLTDAEWRTQVEPVLATLRDLPDQHRQRIQESRMTVTVLERP
jgi:hypothetical protein